jgi:hypothetical protein
MAAGRGGGARRNAANRAKEHDFAAFQFLDEQLIMLR